MSLPTPQTVRNLQAALHAKAKGSPNYRFYALYDKLYREDVLVHALYVTGEPVSFDAGRRCSGCWVGGHPPNSGGDEIVTPWGLEPVGSRIRRRSVWITPNSRLSHCIQ